MSNTENNAQQNANRKWLATSLICIVCGIILFIIKIFIFPGFKEITSLILLKNIFSIPIMALIISAIFSLFIHNKILLHNITILISVAYTVFFLFGLFNAYLKDHNDITKPLSQSFDEVIKASVKEVNKTCPFMSDSETRLDKAIAVPGNIIQFNCTLVNYAKSELNIEEFKKVVEPILIKNAKTSPQASVFRKYKTTMNYSYVDKNGVFLLLISITPDKYE